jgi:hypothetical protein
MLLLYCKTVVKLGEHISTSHTTARVAASIQRSSCAHGISDTTIILLHRLPVRHNNHTATQTASAAGAMETTMRCATRLAANVCGRCLQLLEHLRRVGVVQRNCGNEAAGGISATLSPFLGYSSWMMERAGSRLKVSNCDEPERKRKCYHG